MYIASDLNLGKKNSLKNKILREQKLLYRVYVNYFPDREFVSKNGLKINLNEQGRCNTELCNAYYFFLSRQIPNGNTATNENELGWNSNNYKN